MQVAKVNVELPIIMLAVVWLHTSLKVGGYSIALTPLSWTLIPVAHRYGRAMPRTDTSRRVEKLPDGNVNIIAGEFRITSILYTQRKTSLLKFSIELRIRYEPNLLKSPILNYITD